MDTEGALNKALPNLAPGLKNNPVAAFGMSLASSKLAATPVRLELSAAGAGRISVGTTWSETWKWKLKQKEGDTITLLLTNDKQQTHELQLRVIDHDNIEMTPLPGMPVPLGTIPLKRAKSST